MLTQIRIENFYSVRDPQTINLTVARNAPDLPDRFAALFPGSSERVPKVAIFFGANASGKSTVLRALTFLRWFIQSSFQSEPTARMPLQPFASKEDKGRDTRLAIRFGSDLVTNQPPCLYSYEISIRNSGADGDGNHVSAETLSYYPLGRARRLFHRVGNDFEGSTELRIGSSNDLPYKVRSNASLLSTLAQFGQDLALGAQTLAGSISSNMFIHRLEGISPASATTYFGQNPGILDELNKFISKIDLGISNIEVMKTSDKPIALFHHNGLAVPLTENAESQGTRRFYSLFPYLYWAIHTGGLAVLDEMDTDIHPNIIPEIIGWFQDSSRNPKNAQLLATCHNASLLDHLEKEEVYLTEKDNQGRTTVFGLSDVASIRRSDNFYRKYMSGALGAVPRLG